MARYCTKDGDVLDAICFNHYGGSRGYVEAILEANSGLAGHDAILPAGVIIVLPELPELKQHTKTVHLWD